MQSTVLSSIPPTSSVYAEIACQPSVDSPWVVRRRWMKDKKDNTVVISLFWGVLLPLPILISYILRKIEHNGQLKIETPVLAKVYVNRVCNALQKDLNAIFGENKLYVEVKKTDSEYLQDGKLLLYPMNIESMRVLSDPLNVEVGVPGAMNDPCVFLTQPFYMLAVSYLHNDGCYSEIRDPPKTWVTCCDNPERCSREEEEQLVFELGKIIHVPDLEYSIIVSQNLLLFR